MLNNKSTLIEEQQENDENTNIVNYMLKKYNNIVVKNISLDIKIEDRLYKLIRLNDQQFYLLSKNTIAILEG